MDFYRIDECITRLVIKDEKDEDYRNLLNKEYRFCEDNEDKILKKAKKINEMVRQNRKQQLTDNSCDFVLLEQAYHAYKDKYL